MRLFSGAVSTACFVIFEGLYCYDQRFPQQVRGRPARPCKERGFESKWQLSAYWWEGGEGRCCADIMKLKEMSHSAVCNYFINVCVQGNQHDKITSTPLSLSYTTWLHLACGSAPWTLPQLSIVHMDSREVYDVYLLCFYNWELGRIYSKSAVALLSSRLVLCNRPLLSVFLSDVAEELRLPAASRRSDIRPAAGEGHAVCRGRHAALLRHPCDGSVGWDDYRVSNRDVSVKVGKAGHSSCRREPLHHDGHVV